MIINDNDNDLDNKNITKIIRIIRVQIKSMFNSVQQEES